MAGRGRVANSAVVLARQWLTAVAESLVFGCGPDADVQVDDEYASPQHWPHLA